MARGGAGEQRANSLNGLPAATDHTTHVALSKLKLENGCSGARNFREHHVVRKFDQLPNDELEKFSHCQKPNHESAFAQCYGATGKHESTRILLLQRPSAVVSAVLSGLPHGCKPQQLRWGHRTLQQKFAQDGPVVQPNARRLQMSILALRGFPIRRVPDGWLRRLRRCFRGWG